MCIINFIDSIESNLYFRTKSQYIKNSSTISEINEILRSSDVGDYNEVKVLIGFGVHFMSLSTSLIYFLSEKILRGVFLYYFLSYLIIEDTRFFFFIFNVRCHDANFTLGLNSFDCIFYITLPPYII